MALKSCSGIIGPPYELLQQNEDLCRRKLRSGRSSFSLEMIGMLATNDRRIQMLSLLDKIVFSLLILRLAYVVRQFPVDVIDGIVFSLENTRRLKWIGWLLLVIGLFKPICDFITARWVFSIVRIQNPVLSPPIDPDIALILVSLFVLILSAAFRYGVELEKEHSLTI